MSDSELKSLTLTDVFRTSGVVNIGDKENEVDFIVRFDNAFNTTKISKEEEENCCFSWLNKIAPN